MTTATRVSAAQRRAGFHLGRIAAAGTLRVRTWKAAGWLIAEAKRRPREEWEHTIGQVAELARVLNGRNHDDGE